MADIKIGYLVDYGLWGSQFDPQYIDATESSEGATDLNSVRPEVVAAFNGLAKAACANGGKLLITGAAEKGYHTTGPYGHEGGWKLDIDPDSVKESCGYDTFLELCEKYGCASGDEGNHYDLAFHRSGGTGGSLMVEPPQYLSDMLGDTVANSDNPNSNNKRNPNKKKIGRGAEQYEGFRIESLKPEKRCGNCPYFCQIIKVIKLPEKKTYCEPIYPDLIMVGDFVPKWALDPAAEVTNIGDDSMIQWGKNTNKSDDKNKDKDGKDKSDSDNEDNADGNNGNKDNAGKKEQSEGGNDSGNKNDTNNKDKNPDSGSSNGNGSSGNDKEGSSGSESGSGDSSGSSQDVPVCPGCGSGSCAGGCSSCGSGSCADDTGSHKPNIDQLDRDHVIIWG